MKSVDCFLASVSKGTILSLLFLLISFYGYSQCSCPPVATCGACVGGMTKITFMYDDPSIIPLPATITVTDGGGTIFSGVIGDGGTFEVTADIVGGLFIGNQITISRVLGPSINITTSCGSPIFVGDSFERYKVVSGESQGGLDICCAPEDMETIDPVIIGCPANITTSLSSGSCTKQVDWIEPTASDNCGTVTLTPSIARNSFFPLGPTTVIYTATDRYGNISTCSFVVQVNDIHDPVISGCPSAPITANADATAGICGANVTWAPLTVSDNCTVTMVSNKSPGDFFAVGTTPVTYTATDASGRTETCTFNVVVSDVTSPVITGCPSTITVNAPANACSRTVTWTPPTVTDNCVVSMTSTKSPGAAFNIGTTVVTYTATDASGRQTQCSFNVIVNDVTKPVISGCPSNISVNTLTCNAVVSWTPPTATDICGVTLTSNLSPGATFPVGVTPVTYTATDPSGNVETCTFNVTVRDNVSPVFAGCSHGSILEVTADNSCEAVVTWTPPTASDNCSVTVTSNYNPGHTFPLGKTDVIYTATDPSGNVSVCSFKVFVKDRTNPVITGCPATDINRTATTLCGIVVTWTQPIATDNCDVVLTSDHLPGDFFPIGTTVVTYTATDNSGNISQCSFNVNISDTSLPVISSCPSNLSAQLTGTTCTTAVTWTPPSFSDNCAVTVTSTHVPGAAFPLGTTVVTYSGQDVAGNKSTCSFNVTVTDSSIPTISNCPNDITLTANASCNAVATWTAPTFVDNCSATIVGTHTSGQSFSLGTTTVKYTVTDGAGNQAICSFKVIVIDSTLPVIQNCPSDISVSADVGTCGKSVSWVAPTASDNCAVIVTSNFSPGNIFPEGTTEVIYTATDGSGNTATCSFDVVVKDQTSPLVSNCPQDIEVMAGASCGQVVSWTPPIFTDNCGAPTIVSTHNPNDTFVVGSTTVVYTATDASGNSTTCEFIISVLDQSAPSIVNCPTNITASASTNCAAVVSWTVPSATDNCQATLTSSHSPGSNFALGTTVVTYTAVDAAGNTATCSFSVTVTDQSSPVFTSCATDIKAVASSSCSAIVTWATPAFSDCSNVTLLGTHQSGSEFSVGSTIVSYTATDANGKSAVCTFNVIVEDKTAPAFVGCPSEVIVNASPTCNAVVNWSVPVAADNCGVVSVISSHNPGQTFPVGITPVTYTATDLGGNISECVFNVIVKNQNLPIITSCPSDQVIKVIEEDGAIATWALPTATAECGNVSLSSNYSSGDTFPIGETTVEYNATDDAGNVSVCSFVITVRYEDLEFTVTKLVTPDGDGINDEWILGNIDKFKENRVTVFDRWGSVIFSASGYNNQGVIWKGFNSTGGAVPTGTYFYTITVRYREDYVEQKGFIEVVRP